MPALFAILVLGLTTVSTLLIAQQAGRQQDGFYSGQTGGQSNGQASQRVDGRASRNEGVPPAAGDAAKQVAPVEKGGVNDAQSMDATVRPGLQAR